MKKEDKVTGILAKKQEKQRKRSKKETCFKYYIFLKNQNID
jgi:hypothetical protein